jgi:purine-binding chemotaxis protein CheW
VRAAGADDAWVVFVVGGDEHALPAAAVREVVAWERPRALPTERPHLLGVVPLRGALLPVLDLAGGLGRGGPEEGAIVVLASASGPVGIAVGGVRAVAFAPPGALTAAPASSRVVAGVLALDERLLVALDAAAVLEALGEKSPARPRRGRAAAGTARAAKPRTRRKPVE